MSTGSGVGSMPGRLVRRRAVRATAIALAVLVGSLAIFAVSFHAVCRGDAEPDAPYAPARVLAFEDLYPEYKRTEESTYLTLLEWYQVFSYQEYADFIATERPSQFPYFTAIGQSWSMYCHGYGETQGTYPFNFGNHLMLFVIGTSFSAEYALKGAYEHTSGWFAEFDSYTTPEDEYAAAVAYDYGQFIERDPWYAYPFGSKAVGIWTEPEFFGPDFARKMERKLFFSLENGVKAGYASLIRVATGAIYGGPPTTDHLWVQNLSADARTIEGVEVIEDLGADGHLITLPHYQGFTEGVPALARAGVRFVDLSGNDELVLTAIAPADWTYALAEGEALFSMPIPTDPSSKRVIIRAPVLDLHAIILGLDREGVVTEHLFDY